jgi:hypothetical protein
MQPLNNEPGQLTMMTITAPVHVDKKPLEIYEDQ